MLSRARWSSRELARILLLLVRTFVPEDAPVIVDIDETLERRRGAKIAAKGLYRDNARSSKSLHVKSHAELLEALLAEHPHERVYVAWDNANRHEDDEVEVVLRGAAGRLVLLYLPTYSPWLNPTQDALAPLPTRGHPL